MATAAETPHVATSSSASVQKYALLFIYRDSNSSKMPAETETSY
jgi:hypothetical protein